MRRLYTITMSDGDIYGVPVEVIADNYAKHMQSRRYNYDECFQRVIWWFDEHDYELEEWAKNNMSWKDVEDKVILLKKGTIYANWEYDWVNGYCNYVKQEE